MNFLERRLCIQTQIADKICHRVCYRQNLAIKKDSLFSKSQEDSRVISKVFLPGCLARCEFDATKRCRLKGKRTESRRQD